MSKVIAATVAVLGGGTLAVGAVYLPKLLKQADVELPKELGTLTSEGHSKGCLPQLFPDLEAISDSGSVSASDVTENFLNNGQKKDTEGCLIVNWDKRSKAENTTTKWSGTIRFLWAVRGESKGFIVFLVGTASDAAEKKLKWSGTAYTLALENKKWSAKKKHGVSATDKHFDKNTDDDAKFPKPGEVLKTAKDRTFWGFFSAKGDIDNVAAEDATAKESKYRGYWTWSGGENRGSESLGNWTKDLDKWWEEIFTKTNWDMAKVVQNKQGKWTEVVDKLTPEQNE